MKLAIGFALVVTGIGCCVDRDGWVHEHSPQFSADPRTPRPCKLSYVELRDMKGPVHYRLEYKGINPYPTSNWQAVYVFRVISQSPERGANELTFAGGNPPHINVGDIVECDLLAGKLSLCADAPIESYSDTPAEVIFQKHAATNEPSTRPQI